jgi:hypothetical protein
MTETPRDPHPPNGQGLFNLIEIKKKRLSAERIRLKSSEVTYSIPPGTTEEGEKLHRYQSIAKQAPEGTRYFIADELAGPLREPTQRILRATYYS